MIKLVCSFLIILFSAEPCMAQPNADQWAAAEKRLVRLSPSAFPELPRAVSRYLSRHGYTIPQSSQRLECHNVISGQFRQKGQTDRAVLASRKGASRILVFWNGSPTNPSGIAETADRSFPESNEKGEIRFSRSIHRAGRKYIQDHHQAYGSPKPPPIRHDTINDGFDGKASTVRYFNGRQWIELQGAD
ncbi:MAG: hypothetical protein U0Z53_04955 [Blastocatellia bacterium]